MPAGRWSAGRAARVTCAPDSARLTRRFANAASATQAYQEAAVARKAAIDSFQKTTAGKFLGLSDPQDITKTVGGILGAKDGARQMQSLAQAVAGNPSAQEGLRKAVADHIISIATGATESGTSGINNLKPAVLANYLAKNTSAIRAAGFSGPEMQQMFAVAEDLKRAQRTLQATRLPGQSNTAQDLIGHIEAAQNARPMSLLAKLAGAAYLGSHAGPVGAMMGVGTAVANHFSQMLRGAGMAKSSELVRDAIQNPEFGRVLLETSPGTKITGRDLATLRAALAKNAATNAAATVRGPAYGNRFSYTERGYAKGGAVKGKPTHEFLVARLMRLAEEAKRAEKASTKPILDVPDSTVATALAKAQEAI